MYRHIVFDIDGTLIDTEKTAVLSLIRTVKELMGVDMPYDEARPYFGLPSVKVAPMMGYHDDKEFIDLWEEYFVEMMYLMRPFPGVEEMLVKIRESGLHIGCVTSRNRLEFGHDALLQKLVPYFDVTVTAEDSERHKPFPDPMLAYMRKAEALSDLPVLPEECVYIGDTMHDYCCGHDAGCDFILADWGNRGMQGIPAKKRISSAEEILQCLEL